MTENTKESSSKNKAYENLRYRIITQELPPGELLIEKELMSHYGIGRTPLRDIFTELQRQGLIRRIPRSGTWVAPLDLNYVKQISEVRIPLEKVAGELAAARISKEQVSRLEQILQQAESDAKRGDVDRQALIQLESQFHHILYTATCNRKLEELMLEFQAISSRLWHSVFFTAEHLRKMFDDQRDILEAIKKGDGTRCGELLVKHTQAYFGSLNGLKSF